MAHRSQPIQCSPSTIRSASPLPNDVLRRMRLSPIEQSLLTLLAVASPSPLSDAVLIDALPEARHVGHLHTRMQDLRSRLCPHGLALLRVFNYGYLLMLMEQTDADRLERVSIQ